MQGGGRPQMPAGEMPEGFDPSQMQRPEGQNPPERTEGSQRPERPQNQMPEGFDPENMPAPPEGFDPSQMQGKFPGNGAGFDKNAPQSVEFTISADSRVYHGIAPYTETE